MKHTSRPGFTGIVLALALTALVVVGGYNWRARAFTSRFVAPAPFGDDANAPCDSPDTPCAHIQTAINNSGSGDLIELLPGMYNENVTVNQSVTIQGDAFNPSIVNGGGIGPVFIIQNLDLSSNPLSATLSMMTITNGNAGDAATNQGGGIQNLGTLTVVQSTINGNTTSGTANPTVGGGIFNQNMLTVINSTISGNTASSGNATNGGGGIFNQEGATVTLVNTTINGNTAGTGNGGGVNNNGGTLNFTNTIISGSIAGGDCVNTGAIGTNSHNLVQDGSCSPAVSGNPKLGPLANNGGPTMTHALLLTSPAIDAGDDSVLGDPYNLTTDQRGQGFPRKVCTHVDIGAYEFGAAVPFTLACSGNITAVSSASCPIATSSGPINFTVTSNGGCGAVTVVCKDQNGNVVTSGQSLPSGSTTVTCTGTDSLNNTAQCSFTVTAFSFCLQDETNTGNFVLINAQTGDYDFFCNGVEIASGRGTLNAKGCQGSIEQQKGDRRVFMVWDTVGAGGKGAGTAIVQVAVNKTKCQITDKNMSNNTCSAPQAAAAPVTGKHGKAKN